MNIHQEPNPKNLDTWVRNLITRDMPIFSQTAQKTSAISSMDQGHAAELANAILQDAFLTTRILKMANSAFYLGGRKSFSGNNRSVNTVTRAVMILGFNTILSICQTKALVEDLLKGVQREHLTQKMAGSFHAATQARWLAAQMQDDSPEEVFIAGFLYQLGEMAFWCFADEAQVEEMEKALSVLGPSQDRAALEVLGFPFSQLTLALNKEWHLAPLLQEALEPGHSTNPRIKKIFWGHRMAQAAQKGWNSPEVAQLIDQAADMLTIPRELVTQMVHDNTEEAIHAAISYGAVQAGRLIPVPVGPPIDPQEVLKTASGLGAPVFSGPDSGLQLKILQDLSNLMLEKKPDYGVFISLVLEGIYRAVGLERVLFALFSPDRSRLEVKFKLGWQETNHSSAPALDSLPLNNRLIGQVLVNKQPLWVKDPAEPGMEEGIGDGLAHRIGQTPFFIMPIVVQGKSIGLIYADRQKSGRELEEESFQSFQHFCRQATIGLSIITQKVPSP